MSANFPFANVEEVWLGVADACLTMGTRCGRESEPPNLQVRACSLRPQLADNWATDRTSEIRALKANVLLFSFLNCIDFNERKRAATRRAKQPSACFAST